MINKGFKYIETKTYPNGTKKIISENKHNIIGIHFSETCVSQQDDEYISISIKNKKTNQNKNYYFINTKDNNLPNKYEAIITQYILIHRLSEINNTKTI